LAIRHETALVAGASGGIGRAVAIALAESGLRVGLLARDVGKLEDVRRAMGDAGADAVIAACDLTDRDATGVAVEEVSVGLGSIDVLIYAAGINVRQRSLKQLAPADWDRVLATNLTGAYNLVHFVLPGMRERGNGLIVQVASVSGLRVNTISGLSYSVAKHAQAALGLYIGREERGRGIRSTVLYPGEVNTPLLEGRPSLPGANDYGRSEAILQTEDVVAAVQFLVNLPARAHVPELVMKPTVDDFA
jgi:NADP-dependent 3-hydroxy acid dehydrogenase YdfG